MSKRMRKKVRKRTREIQKKHEFESLKTKSERELERKESE